MFTFYVCLHVMYVYILCMFTFYVCLHFMYVYILCMYSCHYFFSANLFSEILIAKSVGYVVLI